VPDPGVGLDYRISVLAFRRRLTDEVRVRKVRLVYLHEVDIDEEGLVGLGRFVQELQSRLLDIFIEERDPHESLVGRVDVLAIDVEVLVRFLARLARERARSHLPEKRPQLG